MILDAAGITTGSRVLDVAAGAGGQAAAYVAIGISELDGGTLCNTLL